jgi:hypothetical protein
VLRTALAAASASPGCGRTGVVGVAVALQRGQLALRLHGRGAAGAASRAGELVGGLKMLQCMLEDASRCLKMLQDA